jgi:hypothetical protein
MQATQQAPGLVLCALVLASWDVPENRQRRHFHETEESLPSMFRRLTPRGGMPDELALGARRRYLVRCLGVCIGTLHRTRWQGNRGVRPRASITQGAERVTFRVHHVSQRRHVRTIRGRPLQNCGCDIRRENRHRLCRDNARKDIFFRVENSRRFVVPLRDQGWRST